MVPAPQSRATRRVSLSTQATSCLERGRVKPLGTKVAGLEVELAQGVGVFAAGGEADEAEAVAGVEAGEAVLDPALVVGLGEGVVVDDGVPVDWA